MERKWVVVAFGDIKGFGQWTSRAANSRENKDPAVDKFYEAMQWYVDNHKDVHFKYLGDGFMAIKEFHDKDAKSICAFIQTLKRLSKRILGVIKKSGYPKPEGFRIRISSGDVYKLSVSDPNDEKRGRKVHEYVEYATNQAAHLLHVNPEITCLATESVIQDLGSYRSLFRVRKLERPSAYPESVNRIDIEQLRILEF